MQFLATTGSDRVDIKVWNGRRPQIRCLTCGKDSLARWLCCERVRTRRRRDMREIAALDSALLANNRSSCRRVVSRSRYTRSRILLIICGRACGRASAGIHSDSPRFPESVALPRYSPRARFSPSSRPPRVECSCVPSLGSGSSARLPAFSSVVSDSPTVESRSRQSVAQRFPPTARISKGRVGGRSSAGRPDK
jgi:hypothetical protein